MVSLSSRSKQDSATPADFIRAVENCFGKLSFDLAASFYNTKHPSYFAKEGSCDPSALGFDSLKQDWAALSHLVAPNTILFLNPEFKIATPWVKKCHETTPNLVNGVKIGLLIPASVGSNWYRDFVWQKSFTNYLNGRLTFEEDEHPYPKDLMFCLFGANLVNGVGIWEWRKAI